MRISGFIHENGHFHTDHRRSFRVYSLHAQRQKLCLETQHQLFQGSLEMKLYLVQHAKAASKDVDPERPLTDEGRRDIQKIAAFIETLHLEVDLLWHSGKTRAAQTAEVLAEVVNIGTQMTAHDGLSPNDNVTVLKDKLISSRQDVMIVGHLPFLSKLASLFLTGNEDAGTVAFQQGGIVAFEQPAENRWQINWMVIPELLA